MIQSKSCICDNNYENGLEVICETICYDDSVGYSFLNYIFRAISYILRILLKSLKSNNLRRSRYY